MQTDNQWHEGLLVEHADKSFGLYEDLAEACKVAHHKLPKTTVRFQNVRYNWNNGTPKVDFGDFIMTLKMP